VVILAAGAPIRPVSVSPWNPQGAVETVFSAGGGRSRLRALLGVRAHMGARLGKQRGDGCTRWWGSPHSLSPLLCLLSVFPDCLHGQHGTVPAQDGDESPRGDERFAVKVRTRNVVLQYPFACTVEKLTVLWEP
jgi:hypothetical protein